MIFRVKVDFLKKRLLNRHEGQEDQDHQAIHRSSRGLELEPRGVQNKENNLENNATRNVPPP